MQKSRIRISKLKKMEPEYSELEELIYSLKRGNLPQIKKCSYKVNIRCG